MRDKRKVDSNRFGFHDHEILHYVVVGVSHHQSPVEVREQVAISAENLPQALNYLLSEPGIQECMVLSTCNRTELYLSAEDWLDGKDLFVRFANALRGKDMSTAAEQIYVLRGTRAITHLFRVASGLDSQVLGEPQILGQTKAAFRCAEDHGSVDRDLHRWVPRAFSLAKRVRSETGICDAAVSVSYAAVQLAKKIFEDLSGKEIMILGAGKMSALAALHFREAGADSIVVANRTLSRAEELADRCSGTAVDFEDRSNRIQAADVVICSTDAPHYILTREHLQPILKQRSGRPLLLLDMSVPRNVDPEIGAMEGVYLFNVDDLEGVVAANREARVESARGAEALVKRALEGFIRETHQTEASPSIAAIRNHVHAVCKRELERFEQKMPALSGEQREEIELMLYRIAQKIVHPAIMELKEAQDRESSMEHRSFIERIFGLDDDSGPEMVRLG